MRWFVDGNNVMGAGADGWWNDPAAAAAKVAGAVAAWTNAHGDDVVLVFDGGRNEAAAIQGGGRLRVEFAPRPGRDAADDRIVELVADAYEEELEITVATSDRGLVARLPPGVAIEGAGAFRQRIGLGRAGRGHHGRGGPRR